MNNHHVDPRNQNLSSQLPVHTQAHNQGAALWSNPGYDHHEQEYSPKGISLGTVWRAIQRHWWQATILWMITSGGLMFLAFTRVKPTFLSFALLRVEPPRASILGPSFNPLSIDQIKRTHMQLIKAPDVLSDAVSENPEIVQLAELKDTASPEFVMDKKIIVVDRLNSELIEVQMVGTSPQNATDIVNAVVKSYLKQAGRWANETTTAQIGKLTRELEKRNKEVEDLRRNIQLLGTELGAADPELIKDRSRLTLAEYTRMSQALSELEFDRISAESRVERLRSELAQPAAFSHRQNLQDATYEAFYADADVAQLADALEAAKSRLEKLNKVSRGQDVTHRDMNERISEIKSKIKVLWERRRPIIEKQLSQQGAGQTTSTLDRELRDAENQYQDLVVREKSIRKNMSDSKLTLENDESKELQLAFRRADLSNSESIRDSVQRALEQLQFESQGQTQISLIQTARPIGLPSNDKRWRFMAMAPLGMFLAVAGLCVLVEVRSGRVSNPDDLIHRSRLEVLGVVPPLPNPRSARKLMGGIDETRLRRQLVEYIQSIDHLRVAISSGLGGDGFHHSVLITSAFGGEGKTTLSAQLAGRCANAGLSTVVVDGDLRNPTLTRTLEALEMPGLTNLLKGGNNIDNCLVRIGEGGGFHLLPAGTIHGDPSRILEGQKLGKIIAHLRERYEMVIIDSAPVLPVPDALIFGKWVQGIVLAVRYDTSRFPMIERAYKRLSALKAPVLGAVVNGVRNASTTYGGYGYGYGYGYGQDAHHEPESTPDAMEIDVEVVD
jgi:capsular exopolysaccharide synthesis family protein